MISLQEMSNTLSIAHEVLDGLKADIALEHSEDQRFDEVLNMIGEFIDELDSVKPVKARIKRSRDGQWYAILVASNGRTVWQTEVYRRIASARKAIAVLERAGLSVEIVWPDDYRQKPRSFIAS